MIVNWKKDKAGVLVIPVMADDGQMINTIMLLPGHNEIETKEWEGIKKHVNIEAYIDNGDLIEVVEIAVGRSRIKKEEDGSETVIGKKETIAVEFKDMPAKKAREIIQDTWVLPTLEAWLDTEGRDEIRAAIQKQILTIESPIMPKKNNKGSK